MAMNVVMVKANKTKRKPIDNSKSFPGGRPGHNQLLKFDCAGESVDAASVRAKPSQYILAQNQIYQPNIESCETSMLQCINQPMVVRDGMYRAFLFVFAEATRFVLW